MTEAPGTGERAARWIYHGLWGVLVDWFRVPQKPPSLPVASGDTLDAFQPAPGFLAYLKFWFWLFTLPIDLLILVGWIAIVAWRWWVGLLLLPPALCVAVLPDVVAYVAIHLRFDTTWYVMTQRSLRIRRGVWLIHEMTITFENVQNVKVRQGPLQRYFGISSLVVETAGGGAGPAGRPGVAIANRGLIEGVADAERLRDLILARLRTGRGAGLGDEDRSSAGFSARHIAMLREIRDAVREAGA